MQNLFIQKKAFILLLILCNFLITATFVYPSAYALNNVPIKPMSSWSYITIGHYNLHPNVGEKDKIRIYAYWQEWGWSDGYLIVVIIPLTSAIQITNFYDTPTIYYNYLAGYIEFRWYFYPAGGVSGSGSEFRPYINITYMQPLTLTVEAKLYQVYIYQLHFL